MAESSPLRTLRRRIRVLLARLTPPPTARELTRDRAVLLALQAGCRPERVATDFGLSCRALERAAARARHREAMPDRPFRPAAESLVEAVRREGSRRGRRPMPHPLAARLVHAHQADAADIQCARPANSDAALLPHAPRDELGLLYLPLIAAPPWPDPEQPSSFPFATERLDASPDGPGALPARGNFVTGAGHQSAPISPVAPSDTKASAIAPRCGRRVRPEWAGGWFLSRLFSWLK